jgi:cytochrome c
MNMIRLSKISPLWSSMCLGFAACSFVPAPVYADADKGADSFDSNCAECHSVASPPRNKKGPSLFGIIERPAGKIDGFDYSDGLKASGIVWSKEKIDAYITAPKAVIPGGKMKFDGLSDAAERRDLIDFLATKK